MIRLQKALALAQVASRRKAEELILANRVMVNGVIVNELGTKVSEKDEIKVDGVLISKGEKKYYLLNKPEGYLTTLSDPLKRRTIADLFSEQLKKERVYPIGRLDYESSGALLLTNDGTLTNRLIKANNNIVKVYHVRVFGILTQEMVEKLRKGVVIDNILAKVDKISDIKLDRKVSQSEFVITITDGKNRQIRNLIKALNLEIKWVKRLSFADISIDGLKSGEIRALKVHEIKKLYLY